MAAELETDCELYVDIHKERQSQDRPCLACLRFPSERRNAVSGLVGKSRTMMTGCHRHEALMPNI